MCNTSHMHVEGYYCYKAIVVDFAVIVLHVEWTWSWLYIIYTKEYTSHPPTNIYYIGQFIVCTHYCTCL